MAQFLSYLTPTMIFPALVIFLILWFFLTYWHAALGPRPRRGTLEWIALREAHISHPRRLSFPARCHPLSRRDALPILLITALYAVTAFFRLGSTAAPQSAQSFDTASTVTFELNREITLTGLGWYTGLGTGTYTLEVSADGTDWYTLQMTLDEDNKAHYAWIPAAGTASEPVVSIDQKYNTLFKWYHIQPDDGGSVQARYFRLTGYPGRAPMELGELALYDNGHLVDGAGLITGADPTPLFDEQGTVPEASSWYNSSYFDEIYHPRTALEHIRDITPYEISHPPLGKLIIGLGIRMFGMTPFGWRFMGTLFGVGMLPLLYLFLKNLFGKTFVAACGTILFAADFMHLTQTRIATIDTYAVFFILLMYYFLYRWIVQPAGTSFKKGALPLFLSGLFWGIGAASKWTVIYGGIGLAVLYFIALFFKIRHWPAETAGHRPGPWVGRTIAFSVLCFILMPAVIYTLSYIPYARAEGDVSLGNLIACMWENQKYMLSYHSGVTAEHPYSSRWYQWIVDARPILYYLDSSSTPGMKSAFGAFVNPVVCWGGLLALITAVVRMFRRRCGLALFIVIGYFSQLAPWFAIGRTTFEYHYFPSVLFLILALSLVFDDLISTPRLRRGRAMVCGMTAGAVGLYALFYPVLIGLMVPAWYGTKLLKWLPSWPF